MADKKKQVFRIAVALPVKETFSYSVPEKLVPMAEAGRRVKVPFGNQKVTGYILGKEKGDQEMVEGIRDVLDILDPAPLFHPDLVPFFKWMADYYLYPLGLLIKSALPGGLNASSFKSGLITEKGIAAFDSSMLSPEERRLLVWIKENPGRRLPSPLNDVYKLQRKGFVRIESRTGKSALGPLKRKFIRCRDGMGPDSVPAGKRGSARAKNEAEFLKTVYDSRGLSLKKISTMFSNGQYLVKKWIEAGVLESYSETVLRDPAGKILAPSPEPSTLYKQQQDVLKTIKRRLDKGAFTTCLLHGVTGSGKTEVYYQAVKQTIIMGRQSILMVPEIALAIYMEGIFRSRLGTRVTLLHSGLSRGEKYDQWMRILKGDVDLVIGARSALFAPFPRLGLIIVDEEYDFSYKQEEGPRYQARDAAIVRARIEKALVILGAGTPSVQSFHNCVSGRYHLLRMPDRIEKRPLPETEIVDMKEVTGEGKGDKIISPVLKRALEKNLETGKQAILLLNRRGYSSVYLCRSCGEAIRCRNCDLTLTYHLNENRLVCHYCGFFYRPQEKCPFCSFKGMKAYGIGTERLELELAGILPDARISRMDRDSTRAKGKIFQILKEFSEHKLDILVGTQMVAKGYDFPNVTLVGVIGADLSLGFPDFRAGERTFQLLSQVAGRAGRGEQAGKVIVQTYNPGHYSIQSSKNHDYESFYHKEIELREQLGYPPFSYLSCLRFQGNDKKATEEMASVIGDEIKGLLAKWPKRGKEIHLLGPAEAPLARLKGKHRRQILIKSKGTAVLHYLLNEIQDFSKNILRSSGVSMIVDVDPYQML